MVVQSHGKRTSVICSIRAIARRTWAVIGPPAQQCINGSKHGHMRELRTQHGGHPFRTLYAFDPRRMAIPLIGGDKTGDDRWYEVNVPIAERLYS